MKQVSEKRRSSSSLAAPPSAPYVKVRAISCPLASNMTSLDGRSYIFDPGSRFVMTLRKQQNAILNE
jgi:hypothetical protein